MALRFANYLLYNSYVISRVLEIEPIVSKEVSSNEETTAGLSAYNRNWRLVSIRNFVAQLNTVVREQGTFTLIPDIFTSENIHHEVDEISPVSIAAVQSSVSSKSVPRQP